LNNKLTNVALLAMALSGGAVVLSVWVLWRLHVRSLAQELEGNDIELDSVAKAVGDDFHFLHLKYAITAMVISGIALALALWVQHRLKQTSLRGAVDSATFDSSILPSLTEMPEIHLPPQIPEIHLPPQIPEMVEIPHPLLGDPDADHLASSGRHGGSIAACRSMITSEMELPPPKGIPTPCGTVTSSKHYALFIGAYLPASALCALRQADSGRKHAYDDYLLEVFAAELSGRWQDVFQLEAAVHTVAQIAKKGEVSLIAPMAALLAHRHDRVRKAAVSAFPRIVVRGDPAAIAAVAMMYDADSKNTRYAALQTLAEIAERGNDAAIAVVVAAFEDGEGCVRGAAVSAFAHIAVKEKAAAIAAVVALFDDPCPSVRMAALHTLTQIIKNKVKGGTTPLVEVIACLEDAHNDVRLEAVVTLAKIARAGDAAVIAEVSARFTHWHEEVRVAAVYAFTQITKKGSAAIEALSDLLEDAHVAVRFAAVKAIPQIARKGHSASIVYLVARLEDTHRVVRDAAAEALSQIGGGKSSDDAVISALASIAHIKLHLAASLKMTHDPSGEEAEENVLAATALIEVANRRLVSGDQARDRSRTMVPFDLQYRDYLFTEGRVRVQAREADGPRVFRQWQIVGSTRTGASVCEVFCSQGMLNALIALLAIIWVLHKVVSRAALDFVGTAAIVKNATAWS
jgi:HEAT repeat protein